MVFEGMEMNQLRFGVGRGFLVCCMYCCWLGIIYKKYNIILGAWYINAKDAIFVNSTPPNIEYLTHEKSSCPSLLIPIHIR